MAEGHDRGGSRPRRFAVLIPYLLTTGSLYRVDAAGELLLDRALQRDALFHLGVARSLETSYPPRLLSVSGAPVVPLRVPPAARALVAVFRNRARGRARPPGRRLEPRALRLRRRIFCRDGSSRAKDTADLRGILVLGSGFGFAFSSGPAVDWWSLTFMDWALVSIFLANPLLAALPLLFVGLALLHDYGRPALAERSRPGRSPSRSSSS